MAKVIMIQGTMSDVGKSLITAGLCRVFHQDGFRTAPFKSQNMALNSYVTKDGSEIGRAQAMQAEAAGIEPTVDMNPILLKPTTEIGSQVVVNGHSIGTMEARDYFAYKTQLIPAIMHAYRRLEQVSDLIVIEGAGSPAEINLKADDIVNMGLAKLVDAPVLLVGDIDRGGVFAQLLGTLDLLEEDERARVKGLIVNQFRGDKTLFQSGIKVLEERSGIPVMGVIPHAKLDIDAEDSLADSLKKRRKDGVVDIAVIRFPYISNFTDFHALEMTPELSVRYVTSYEELGTPDMVILPGTKSTMADLKWMRKNGLETGILKLASTGTLIWGICGGYQMLGETLKDPYGVEGGGRIEGMCLLPLQTMFGTEKTQKQVRVTMPKLSGSYAALSELPVYGYEIHMGQSELPEGFQFDGNVYGSYLHGVFDSEDLREALVGLLMKKAMQNQTCENSDSYFAGSYEEYKEQEYDKLADLIRNHMDMQKIYQIIGVR